SLARCCRWVKTASKEVGTVSTVSTDCCKPLKRFWCRCQFFTQLKQGVNESRPVFARQIRNPKSEIPQRGTSLKVRKLSPLRSSSGFGFLSDFGFRVSDFEKIRLSQQARTTMAIVALSCAIAMLGGGCKKSSPADESRTQTTAAPPSPVPQTAPVASIHWLGKKRIAAETNAAGFMKIWNLPESAKLVTQTTDKLSTAPWP